MAKPRGGSSGASGRRGGGASSAKSARKPKDNKDKKDKTTGPSPEDQQLQRQQQLQHQQHQLPFALQQRLLDVFAHTLRATLASPRLQDALQAVKRALFERDFASAFGGDAAADDGLPPLLDAYAARWSPTRALGYAAILGSPLVQKYWRQKKPEDDELVAKTTEPAQPPYHRMVALGGAAAEIVAFGALLALDTDGDAATAATGHVVLVDSGPWASVVDRLQSGLTEATTTDNAALIHPAERLSVDVRQLDLLAMDDEAMAALFAATTTDPAPTTLVTLFFTLNELFTAGGLGAAATFLLRLTAASPTNTVLLVVDSPGSYSETAVGAAKTRRYPMQWLMDKFLLQASGDEGDAADSSITDATTTSASWAKVHQDDSVWFRLPPSLRYPIRLEDMRYQVHLYVRR